MQMKNLIFFTMLTLIGCSSRNSDLYRSSLSVESPFLSLMPMAYVFPQMPSTVGIFQKDGTIVPHPKLKNHAVRFERGHWAVRGKRVEIKYHTFNAFSCETSSKDCSLISKEHRVELNLDSKQQVKGLRSFTEVKNGLGQLYYNDNVVKNAPETF
jgi:hypothetical protein